MYTLKLQIAALAGTALLALPTMAQAPDDLKQQYLVELQRSSEKTVALAQAIPRERYSWRPGDSVRSVSEVFLHIALGNFLLLDIAGVPAPEDLYALTEVGATSRIRTIIERNQNLERTITDKERVLELLKRSLESVEQSFAAAAGNDLERPVRFAGRDTQIRAVYLRMLIHLNEHMGQAIAYARVNKVVPPWSATREDR